MNKNGEDLDVVHNLPNSSLNKSVNSGGYTPVVKKGSISKTRELMTSSLKNKFKK